MSIGARARLIVAAAAFCLTATTATAHPRYSTDAHPATCDGKSVTFHVHRAHVLYRSAYALERWDQGPKRSDVRKAQRHRRCIEVATTRRQLSDFRTKHRRLLDQYRASQEALADITPPGPEYLAGLRACESGGDYSTNTGNGFYGAYQFDLQTWASVGGSGLPSSASPAEQDFRAALLWRQRGSAPWPVCG